MAGWNAKEYELVDTRIHRFYERHENGRIHTELVYQDEKRFIVKAYAYRDYQDEAPSATGYAEEWVGSNPVNKTSALENCETSAIGRALANLGLSPKGSRPSLEEMEKSERIEQKPVMGPEQYAALADSMRGTDKLDVLNTIAQRAKTFDMSEEQRTELRALFLERKHEIEAAA